MVIVGEDSLGVKAERFGKTREHGDTGGFGVQDPLHQERLGGFLVLLFPDLIEFLLEVVGRGQRFIQSQGFLKAFGLVVGGIEVFRPLEQEPTNALEHVFLHRVLELAIQGSPQFRKFVVVEFDHMETVKHQADAGQMGRHGVDVCGRHVRGHGLDVGPRSAEPGPELRQGVPTFSLAHVNHRAAFEVQNDRQVDMPLARGNLVDGDLPQVFQFRLVKTPLQIGLLDLFDHVPTDAQVVRHVLDGHVLGELQGIPLKGFAIADARIGEPQLHLSDRAAATTLHPGDRQHQVHGLAADRDRAEATAALPSPDNMVRPTNRTTVRFPWLRDGENHLTSDVFRLHIPVAADPERMVK